LCTPWSGGCSLPRANRSLRKLINHRRAYGGRQKIRGAVSEPDPMGKSPKRTTGAACGNCPHHHFVETTLHSRYQNSCATPEGNHQQRKLLRGLTPTTETAGSCGAPGHREASVPGGGCPFPGREPMPGAWERPTHALDPGLVTIKSYETRNCNFKCN